MDQLWLTIIESSLGMLMLIGLLVACIPSRIRSSI